MQQRRRTAAQWTSENPVLAAGEIGCELGGGGLMVAAKIGDGTTVWTSLPYYDLQTFQRLQGGSALPTGSATIVVSSGWAGWNFPDAATSGIAFAQSFPPSWTTAALSWGYVPITGGSNVRWTVNIRRVNALGFGDLITDAAQTTDTFTQAAGTTNQMEHCFNHPSTFDCHNGDAVFGEVVNITIERLGSDAADTSTAAMLLTNFSVNRLT